MYEQITGENPYKVPMRIYPAVHYTMGGLWVDYNLMSTIPGLFVLGEANFSDHGANRLGASALMQGLADGYFVLPVHDRRLPRATPSSSKVDDRPPRVQARPRPRSQARIDTLLGDQGQAHRSTRSTASSASSCGTTAAWRAPRRACARRSTQIPELREEFWQRRQRARRRRASSTSRSRRPAASPTSSSSAS